MELGRVVGPVGLEPRVQPGALVLVLLREPQQRLHQQPGHLPAAETRSAERDVGRQPTHGPRRQSSARARTWAPVPARIRTPCRRCCSPSRLCGLALVRKLYRSSTFRSARVESRMVRPARISAPAACVSYFASPMPAAEQDATPTKAQQRGRAYRKLRAGPRSRGTDTNQPRARARAISP